VSDTTVVDGTAEEVGTDLTVAPQQQATTLFRTDDPVEVIERATRAADALKGVLTRQNLTQNIQGKEYVRVEGWTTLGSMLGVVPVVAWTRPIEKGWEARVEARTLDGRTIGAAEAQCTTDESMWRSRPAYALRSMAQTRATSKALRGPLGFIVTLAGFEATPSEEMPAQATEPAGQAPRQRPAKIGRTALKQLTDQLERYEKAGLDFARLEMQAVAVGGQLDLDPQAPSLWHRLTREQGLALYEWMQSEIEATA
jgi:hypothetical protein